jgi:DNA-binding GntR family transcriptional regulator
MAERIQTLPRVSTVEALAAVLRRQILTGELPPGSQLREIELAQGFGVGRHSLRAALQALVHEGLLHHEPHRGVFVPQMEAADVEDLFRLRTALEVEAARTLVLRGTAVDDAVRCVEALEALSGDEPWDEVIELDLGFHRALIDAVGSRHLSQAFASLQAQLRLMNAQLRPQYERADKVGREHRAVLDAILSGDVATAERALRAHLEHGVQEIVSPEPQPGAPV